MELPENSIAAVLVVSPLGVVLVSPWRIPIASHDPAKIYEITLARQVSIYCLREHRVTRPRVQDGVPLEVFGLALCLVFKVIRQGLEIAQLVSRLDWREAELDDRENHIRLHQPPVGCAL